MRSYKKLLRLIFAYSQDPLESDGVVVGREVLVHEELVRGEVGRLHGLELLLGVGEVVEDPAAVSVRERRQTGQVSEQAGLKHQLPPFLCRQYMFKAGRVCALRVKVDPVIFESIGGRIAVRFGASQRRRGVVN